MAQIEIHLLVKVVYELNGEDPQMLQSYLQNIVQDAAGDGRLTGSSYAEVDAWSTEVSVVK